MSEPIIRRLDEDVVNRIAAGEVIQRPANAIKEMLENCLDAGSTSITVIIKGGGLKMLQISDNGHGIRREDMEIVCERFTTSKLKEFSDLRSIATFGFRGEALASISHVSHLTICTKTKNSKCAYKATYMDGKIKDTPRPTAGNVGTQITVEDLFYNVPTRRKALTNASEETQKIADVITKYSIHNSGVAFTLRKAGDSGGISVRTQQGASIMDNIGIIYGTQISKELLPVTHENDKLKYKMSGYITNANCALKKFIFLLFINNRLVDCTALKRSLDSVYQAFLPKGSHPFAYLSLQIAPQNIDVNIHPTKHEVHFLHEDDIIESVQKAVETELRGCNSSRTFYTQTLLPNLSTDNITSSVKTSDKSGTSQKVYDHYMVRTDSKLQKLDAFFGKNTSVKSTPISSVTTHKQAGSGTGEVLELPTQGNTTANDNAPGSSGAGVMEVDVSEVDSVSGTAEALGPNAGGDSIVKESTPGLGGAKIMEMKVPDKEKPSSRTSEVLEQFAKDDSTLNDDTTGPSGAKVMEMKVPKAPQMQPAKKQRIDDLTTSSFPKRRQIQLTSVLELQEEIKNDTQADLVKVIRDHTWVGCVDPELALVQHGTKLFMLNTTRLSEELFYQIMIHDFGNFGIYRLSEPAPTFKLVMLALEDEESGWRPADGNKVDLANNVVEFLKEKSEMLADYFSMEFDKNGNITGLPMLLRNYAPVMEGLPMFVLRLTTEVDWESEIDCFRTFCKECAKFYSVRKGFTDLQDILDETMRKQSEKSEEPSTNGPSSTFSLSQQPSKTAEESSWKWTIEHVIYRAFQKTLSPTKTMLDDGTFLQLADLPDLYKVFERC